MKKDTDVDNPTASNTGSRPIYFISLIAIILSVLALIEGTYVVSQLHNAKVKYVKAKKNFELLPQKIAALSNQLQPLKASIAANELKLSNTATALKGLNQFKFTDNTQWMLVEIKYLLTLAQYNLQLVSNPMTALAILEKVNEQLARVNDPNVLPLRQQVISDILKLKSLPTIDYAGILMQLNAISDQLKTMPLLIDDLQNNEESMTTTETKGWRQYWQNSLKTLEKLVIIRHQDNSTPPLISPKQQQFLQENIQLKLSQASWALLQHNQEVYTLSLQEAINWIQTYYSPNAAATTNAIDSLQSLMKINLQPDLPNLNQTLQIAEILLDNKQSLIKGVK